MTSPMEAPLSRERRVFGEYEQVQLPVDQFVRLPQVRSDINPEIDNLEMSIDKQGLLNQVDVARMDEVALAEYVDFVNSIWDTDVCIEDYADQRQADGSYYLVIAGHSRMASIERLAAKDPHRTYVVTAKLHEATSVEKILAIQLDENIHSKPAQEPRAIAIVEMFFYGLLHNKWSSKSDFLRKQKQNFSKKVLDEALGFASLPKEIRDMVFGRVLSFVAGVSLGNASDKIYEYLAAGMNIDGDTASDDEKTQLKEAYRIQMVILVGNITRSKMNGPASKKYIAGQLRIMEERLAKARGESSGQQDALFSLVSAAEQARTILNPLRAEYRQLLREVASDPYSSAERFLQLSEELTGIHDEEAMDVLAHAARETIARMGSVAVGSSSRLPAFR